MDTKELDESAIQIELTRRQVAALNNVLVWLRMHMHADDYHTILGLEKDYVEQMRQLLAMALDDPKALNRE